jgi:hypothetical protein
MNSTTLIVSYVARMISTVAIWSAVIVISVVSLGVTSRLDDWATLALLGGVVFGAVVGTRTLWRNTGEGVAIPEQSYADSARGKPKRNSRDRLLATLNALDDEEAAEVLRDIRTRLAGGSPSDGELDTIESLMRDRQRSS